MFRSKFKITNKNGPHLRAVFVCGDNANMSIPKPIPASHTDLVEKPLLANLAVTLADGTPQVTPVWFNTDEAGHFYFNTAKGRLKAKALEGVKYAAILIMDPTNTFRYLAIRGPVVASEAEGRAHINALSKRYTGNPVYGFGPPDEVRIRYMLTPEHVSAIGN